MNLFGRPTSLLTIAGILVLVIVVVIAIARLTSSAPRVSDAGLRGCAIARQALDAFDHGKAPPVEWIQDRAAAAEAVKNCKR